MWSLFRLNSNSNSKSKCCLNHWKIAQAPPTLSSSTVFPQYECQLLLLLLQLQAVRFFFALLGCHWLGEAQDICINSKTFIGRKFILLNLIYLPNSFKLCVFQQKSVDVRNSPIVVRNFFMYGLIVYCMSHCYGLIIGWLLLSKLLIGQHSLSALLRLYSCSCQRYSQPHMSVLDKDQIKCMETWI